MSEQVITQTVNGNVTDANVRPVQAEPKADDIVSRASAFKAQPKEGENSAPAADAISFNVKDLDKITDPAARKFAEDAYKSLQADYTRKTQALATEKKEMASLKAQLEQSGQYTPSKIQELLSNPSFVQAAREYEASQRQQTAPSASELTEEEFSYLSPEQQKLYLNQKKMHGDTQAMLSSLNNELVSMKTQKEDMELSQRYKNYDSHVVNQTYQDMMSGKVNATREHLWKALDYEEAVKRAYQLGRTDEKSGITERQQASTQVNGVTTQKLDADIPLRQKGESFSDHWKRVVESAKTKLGQK